MNKSNVLDILRAVPALSPEDSGIVFFKNSSVFKPFILAVGGDTRR